MTSISLSLCGDDRMQTILAAAGEDTQRGAEAIERTLVEFPEDPRLHFLLGSLLIELRRFIEAHAALSRAVELAPEFHIARFQLGFFELTSGEADAARSTWQPLERMLPPDHFLVGFVTGLEALIADRFSDCIADLREGIARNDENPALNRDMELIIGKCEELLARQSTAAKHDAPEEVSATSFLLGTRRH